MLSYDHVVPGTGSNSSPLDGEGLRPAGMHGPDSSFAIATRITATSQAVPVDVDVDVAMCDWSDLFDAVKSRLCSTVGDCLAISGNLESQQAANQIQTSVLQCVTALDQLHTTIQHELKRRQQLELEVFDAQTALAQARSEIEGMRARP